MKIKKIKSALLSKIIMNVEREKWQAQAYKCLMLLEEKNLI